jgi:hypothetical protein
MVSGEQEDGIYLFEKEEDRQLYESRACLGKMPAIAPVKHFVGPISAQREALGSLWEASSSLPWLRKRCAETDAIAPTAGVVQRMAHKPSDTRAGGNFLWRSIEGILACEDPTDRDAEAPR